VEERTSISCRGMRSGTDPRNIVWGGRGFLLLSWKGRWGRVHTSFWGRRGAVVGRGRRDRETYVGGELPFGSDDERATPCTDLVAGRRSVRFKMM